MTGADPQANASGRASRAARCLLFVPAHAARMTLKAQSIAVDAIVLDLEDAVPPGEKPAARAGSREFVAARPGRAFVRINPLAAATAFSIACGLEDIEAVVRPGLRGVVLPKVECAADAVAADTAITIAEQRHGIAAGSVELFAIVETARGIAEAPAIAGAAPKRPYRLCFGAGDFTTDIGAEWTRDEEESRVARGLVIIASRAAGLPQPIDSVFADIGDAAGLAQSAAAARRLGFGGKFVIQPAQVAAVTQAFTPSAQQLAGAR
ncbi:MAG: CoA ester lyase, partial [Lautropia sp.]